MKKQIEWTDKLHNALVELFAKRMAYQNIEYGSKRWREKQMEFFVGAISSCDLINNNYQPGPTCMPGYFFPFCAGGAVLEKRLTPDISGTVSPNEEQNAQ